MELIKLRTQEFSEFVNNHPSKSFYQSLEYARFLEEQGFEYDLIGLKDKYDNIRAASLIAYKKCFNNYYYGYAPGGFLIDYSDLELVKDFGKALMKYYKKEKIIFIKIVPNIIISKLNKVKNEFILNDNIKYIDNLKKIKFQQLKKNLYFESLLPKYRPIVDLSKFCYNSLSKNTRNKIRKCYRKGLSIDKGNVNNLKDIYPFIKGKSKCDLAYYEELYHSFETNNKIDVFMVSVDFEEYLINMKDEYQKELQRNNMLVKKLQNSSSEKDLDRKMQSDKELLNIKNNIVIATNGLANAKKKIIAGAIVIKYNKQAIIFESGYDKKYKDCNPNYFLNYKMMEYYKYNYESFDMNGFSGDLTKASPYYGVNDFKLGFGVSVYESIGEFDLILNKKVYKKISSNGTLAKLFMKKNKED